MGSILTDIVNACHASGLNVRALSSNGQFYKLAVRDHHGKPLTVYQLAKDTWLQAKKLSKNEQMAILMSANRPVTNDDIKWERKASSSNNVVNERKENGPLVVYGRKMTAWKTYITPKDIQLLRLQGKSKVKNAQSTLQQSEAFSCLPADVMNSLQENFTTSDDVNSIDTDLELDVRSNRCLNTENQEESITETSDIKLCDELERILIVEEDMEIETGEIETPVLAFAYLVSKL